MLIYLNVNNKQQREIAFLFVSMRKYLRSECEKKNTKMKMRRRVGENQKKQEQTC